MTHETGDNRSIAYNYLDLPSQIKTGTVVSVNYSYLADGMKISALTPSGEGLVYFGDFVYRQSSSGSLSFESVPLRYHFTAKEDQETDFGLPFTDFGARQYSHTLHRWLVPDPMGEKYYDISPYAYCAGNPVMLVEPDGEDYEEIIDDYIFDERGFWTKVENCDPYDRLIVGDNHIIVKDKSILGNMTSITYPQQWGQDAVMTETLSLSWNNSMSKELTEVFYFLADNTNVEWILLESASGPSVLATEHLSSEFTEEPLSKALINTSFYECDPVFRMHNHPIGYRTERESMSIDVQNVRNQPERSSVVYFSKSKNIYQITPKGPNFLFKRNGYAK